MAPDRVTAKENHATGPVTIAVVKATKAIGAGAIAAGNQVIGAAGDSQVIMVAADNQVIGAAATAAEDQAIGVAADSQVTGAANNGVTGVAATAVESHATGMTKADAGVTIAAVPARANSAAGGIARPMKLLRGLVTKKRNADVAWTHVASIAVVVRKTTGDLTTA